MLKHLNINLVEIDFFEFCFRQVLLPKIPVVDPQKRKVGIMGSGDMVAEFCRFVNI